MIHAPNLLFIKRIHQLLLSPDIESLKLSMKDTHHKGVFSLVVKGTEFGKLTRIFITDKKLKPFDVQLHTHRYPITLTMVKGAIKHYTAIEAIDDDFRNVKLSEFDYKSPLNGGSGLKFIRDAKYRITEYFLPIGSILKMTSSQFHTMSCSKGSIWIVEEGGFETESSKVLGVPFVTDGLYNEPKPFQINDKCQIVLNELRTIIDSYKHTLK